MSKKDTITTSAITASEVSVEKKAKAKPNCPQRAKSRRAPKASSASIPDPTFEFHLALLLNARLKRVPFHDWQVIRCSNRELHIVGRTPRGREVSSALRGISFDTLICMSQEEELLVLTGTPNPYGDMGLWSRHCVESGTEESTTVDISAQVWQLALAMNGMLTTAD